MRVTVIKSTKTSIFGNTSIATSRILDGENGQKVMEPVLEEYEERLKEVAQRHYRNLGTGIKRQLNRGIGDPWGPGKSHVVKGVDGEGQPLSIRTAWWPQLSEPYRSRKPRSSNFWRKRGKLYNSVQSELPRNFLNLSVVRKGQLSIKNRKGQVKAENTLKFRTPSSQALAKLMSEPFVYGDEGVASNFSTADIPRRGSGVLAYAEAATIQTAESKRVKTRGRPWVARLSGGMGARMRTAIRKL